MKRKLFIHGAFVTACLVGFGVDGIADDDEKPLPNATVELTVRGPDGRLLANAELEIRSGERAFGTEKRPSTNAKTDTKGKVSFSWPVGVHRLVVTAKGTGYGTTGSFELIEGETARPPLAPLVAFGTIEGVVPKEVLKPGTYVEPNDERIARRADCDESGHFIFKNVPDGVYRLTPKTRDKELGIVAFVHVIGGQHVMNVSFRSLDKTPMFPGFANSRDRGKEAVWAAGTVHDESGAAVEGADVFVLSSYHGAMRMYEAMKSAQSDKQGHWEIRGTDNLPAFSGTIVAHKPGHPFTSVPMISPMRVEGEEDEEGTPKPNVEVYDLILPSDGGNLEVAVLADGKPVEKAAVQLYRKHGPSVYSSAYVGSERGAIRQTVQNLLCPTDVTDSQGIVRFSDLPPDEYEFIVATGGIKAISEIREHYRYRDVGSYATIAGVAVRKGETRRFKVAVYPQPNKLRMQVKQPNGQPCAKGHISFSYYSMDGIGWSTGLELDENGSGVHVFDNPGLWSVEFFYTDPLAHRRSAHELPHFETRATVGVSALWQQQPTVALTSSRHGLGSLVVELRDSNGKPLRGYVCVDRGSFDDVPTFVGSTDEHGVVRFEGVQAREHKIEACLLGQSLPALESDDSPLPADRDLIGLRIPLSQTKTTSPDTETSVVIRPEPIGYVRGTIKPPSGRKAVDYRVPWSGGLHEIFGSAAHYNKDTGEFVMGPFAEGKTMVTAIFNRKGWLVAGTQEVTIRGDRIDHVEITPLADPKEAKQNYSPKSISIGMGGVSLLGGDEHVAHGKVFLSDGQTPAYGAQLAYFVPKTEPAIGSGSTDALGRIYVGGTWYPGGQPQKPRPDSPTEPVLVTWLPGSCGATITPITSEDDTKESGIVLPPPLAVQGKVTVGGKPVDGRHGQIRILAQYEGKGKIDSVLSRFVSADADGNFELPGLTPGIHRVQATLDNIWLSSSTRLTVGTDAAALKPLLLDIGEPGASSILKVVDREGKPLADVKATVPRPEGPLADAFWPRDLVSDGAGVIHVPPLESGTQKVQVGGAAKQFTIPALSAANAKPVELEVVVEQ